MAIMITVEDTVPIATVSLVRGPVNAIDSEFVNQLAAALDLIELNPEISAFRLTSDQHVFCAGANLDVMRRAFDGGEGSAPIIKLTRQMQEVFLRIEEMATISIAEVNGHAFGGGFELALACDLRLVAHEANIGLPEARLGLLPAAGGTQRLTRIAGEATAKRLILGAEIVSGANAVAMGLAQWSAPQHDFATLSAEIAARLAELPNEAVRACKRCIHTAVREGWNAYELELEESRDLLDSPVSQARVRSFLSRKARA